MKIRELNSILNKIAKINSVVIKPYITDHYRFTVVYKGKIIMRKKFSFGSKEKSGDERSVAKDLHFRVDELTSYASCAISNEVYLWNLKAKSLI